jgi:uncharacterized membrane protein
MDLLSVIGNILYTLAIVFVVLFCIFLSYVPYSESRKQSDGVEFIVMATIGCILIPLNMLASFASEDTFNHCCPVNKRINSIG